MKKKFLILFITFTLNTLLLAGCSNITEHTPDDCPEVFIAGQQDALDKLQYSAEAKWYVNYVDVKSLETVLRNYFGDDADEIRDMIIYHPDVEHYNTTDIVNDLINEYNWEE